MRLKVTLARASGTSDDIVITADAAATIGEIAEAVAHADPRGAVPAQALRDRSDKGAPANLTLATLLPGEPAPLALPRDVPVGEAWVGSGVQVAIAEVGAFASAQTSPTAQVVARLTVISGPDAGRAFDLRAGTTVVGRAASCDIVLNDTQVSKRHVRLEVAQQVEVVDLGSANGVVVDGGIVARVTVPDRETLLLGSNEVEIVVLKQAASASVVARSAKSGPVLFNRSPRVENRYSGSEFAPPEVPKEPEDQPFPVIALLTPVLLGLAMYFVTQRPMALMFIAFAPLMLIGNHFTTKRAAKRKLAKMIARFDEGLESLTTSLAKAQVQERTVRLGEAPSTEEAYSDAVRYGPLLWTRRPEHWSFLNVRLGIGRMRSRNTISEASKGELLPEFRDRLDTVVGEYEYVDGVPLIDNLFDAGALGIAGQVEHAASEVNSVMIQITALHSPSEVVVAALLAPRWSHELEWLKWLPHTSSAQSPLGGRSHLADGAASGANLLAALEGLVTSRLSKQGAQRRGAMEQDKAALERGAEVGKSAESDGTAAKVPAIVVLISDDVPLDRSRLVQLAELGPDAGVFPIWISETVPALPAACRTYVSVPGGAELPTVGFVRLGEVISGVQTEPVVAVRALDYAKRMAPVIDAGAIVEDDSDLPRSVSMVSLLGHDMVESPDVVIDRWQQNESIHDRSGAEPRARRVGKLRATVGSAGVDAMHLDLRGQGPHALVGGTTGAGKSEFLQAWVLGMAAEYSSDRVTFLFVDYKGGSAFAECVNLPHCVGLVTDLSPHLVRRALTSLRAELHHREHLLNRKKAKDLLELEKRGDPESPPALVLVIDEFAALVNEVPEFVDGVVDIAQRGRSLGIHLIMATQRPAGVIKDNLRANTPLRIALRMADESDSSDVIGTKDAAHFDPGVPGRAVAKTGPGRLAPFQSGYAGGWTSREPDQARIEVAELRFGAEVSWEQRAEQRSEVEVDLGPTDQQRLVTQIVAAADVAQIPPPRRPWLDEMSACYDLSMLRQRTDSELVLGVSDIPERQQQITSYFHPDTDGHLAIYGTGGSGKSTVLRTLAVAAGITPRGGPVEVYALDFGTGSMRMLGDLPHVGAVISGDDPERIIRLFRRLKKVLDERGKLFAAANAASITEYRQITGQNSEPRILVVIDGYPSFRDEWEAGLGRIAWYQVFRDILNEGRPLGVHVAFTADRPGAVPSNVSAAVQRRVVLRMADEMAYNALDVATDILGSNSVPGRAIVDGLETQIAVFGGSPIVANQADAVARLAKSMANVGIRSAPPVGALPTEYAMHELPDHHDGAPVLGISELELGPLGFTPSGVMIVSGPPASGRSNALAALVGAIRRAEPEARVYYFGTPRSALSSADGWTDTALTVEATAALARSLAEAVADPDTEGRIVVLVETVGDYLQTPADAALVELIKAIKRSDHLLIAEGETASWTASWGMLNELKSGRRGLLLQPDYTEGEFLLKTPLPRGSRAEYPVGRGVYIDRGKVARVQLPLVSPQ